GQVVGVVSYAIRPRDGAGVVLWLHGRENRGVIDTLLDHTLSRLGKRPIEAFSFATALGLGMEALPVQHRPATAAALTDHGFLGSDLWRYMRVDLPVTGLPRTSYTVLRDEDRLTLTVRDGATPLGEATIGQPVQGIGVLWWISVEPAARRRGLGRALLGSALDLLTELGAREVILYVDDDEPGGERDRTAANRLYEQAGFVEVDRLLSCERPRGWQSCSRTDHLPPPAGLSTRCGARATASARHRLRRQPPPIAAPPPLRSSSLSRCIRWPRPQQDQAARPRQR